ncbi:hypothetical protein ACFV29_19345 [Streptomyces sp. NPDC059690]|uniref:hypothetical protein n=1 Tax=Streptomyces sp. NPDC059690 TaxID=3346907 RepID=UPI0036AA186C
MPSHTARAATGRCGRGPARLLIDRDRSRARLAAALPLPFRRAAGIARKAGDAPCAV